MIVRRPKAAVAAIVLALLGTPASAGAPSAQPSLPATTGQAAGQTAQGGTPQAESQAETRLAELLERLERRLGLNMGTDSSARIDRILDALEERFDRLERTTTEVPPRLGVSALSLAAYPQDVRSRYQFPAKGVAIVSVEPGTAASAAGLSAGSTTVDTGSTRYPVDGDIVTRVNSREVSTVEELRAAMDGVPAGSALALTVWRDGKTREVKLTLSATRRTQRSAFPSVHVCVERLS
jgi:S1-C subfamily serine protease